MHVNRQIIVTVVGITGITVGRILWLNGAKLAALAGTGQTPPPGVMQPVTPVLIGGYVLMLVLSLADLAGGQISVVVGGIAMLALFTAVLTGIPWALLLPGGKPATTTTTTPSTIGG